MARGLANYPNIIPADSDYPNGDIKDAPSGTPRNRVVYSDMQQVFGKMMRRSTDIGQTGFPNGLPDNEYNGFQYIEAFRQQLMKYSKILRLPDGAGGTIPLGSYTPTKNYLIIITGSEAGKVVQLFPDALSTQAVENCLRVKIVNKSSQSIQIQPGTNNAIDGGGNINLSAGAGIYFILDKANSNWLVTKSFS